MRAHKLRQLAALLYTNNSVTTRSYVQEQLRELGLDMTNLCQELEMTNQFVEYFRYEGHDSFPVQIHNHRFFEIVYCPSNCEAEYLVGTQRYQLQRGDILVVPPGISHAIMLHNCKTEPFKGIFLWVSLGFMESLRSVYPFFKERKIGEGLLVRTTGTAWEHLREYFYHAVEETELQIPGWEAIISGITTVLMAQLSRAIVDASSPSMTEKEPDLMDEILAYVERFLSEKISLEETANRFFVSQSTITHMFQKRMGVSFYKYITQSRLTEAKNLIREGMPMEKIAAEVGFRDYSSFYRAFKKECGISPLQFSKLIFSNASQKPETL